MRSFSFRRPAGQGMSGREERDGQETPGQKYTKKGEIETHRAEIQRGNRRGRGTDRREGKDPKRRDPEREGTDVGGTDRGGQKPREGQRLRKRGG